jgi:hypothetical protein
MITIDGHRLEIRNVKCNEWGDIGVDLFLHYKGKRRKLSDKATAHYLCDPDIYEKMLAVEEEEKEDREMCKAEDKLFWRGEK